jgi:hypothetical protein
MKKLLPVLAAFLLLLVAYFIVSSSDDAEQRRVRWSIEPPESIGRIEVERPIPLDDEGREQLIFEQSGDAWRIVSPIEAGVPRHVAKKLDSLFSGTIEMDDLELPAKELEQYGLDDENVALVSLHTANREPVTFDMGLGFKTDVTNVTRTYVRSPRGKVYRARTDAGIVLRQPVSFLRDKNLFTLQADELNVMILENEHGRFRFVPDGAGGWTMTEPDVAYAIEQPLLKTLERQLSNFHVRSFRTGGKEKWGLDDPDATMIVGTRDGDRRLDVKVIDEDRRYYLAVLDRSDDVLELLPTLGNILVGDINTFRDRLTRSIGRDRVVRVELAGEAGVVVERQDDGAWKQLEPVVGEVSPKELGKFLGNLEMLSVIRYGDAPADELGLTDRDARSEVVATDTSGTRHVLVLGAPTDRKDGRWAMWNDGDDVFVIPDNLYERLHPGPTDLLKEQQ